uniref:hypothetical protein n=1 Tax=Dialister invisus TaxID=218538 RepID=UPI003C6F969E
PIIENTLFSKFAFSYMPSVNGKYEKANLENKVFSIIGHQTGMTFALIGRACFILFVLRKIIVDFIKDIIL